MSDSPSGSNHGSVASSRRPTTDNNSDGESWGSAHRSLDSGVHAAAQFVASGGATIVHRTELAWHGARGYEPGERHRVLSPTEMAGLDKAVVRAAVLDELGFTDADMALLDKTGRNPPATRALRARFDARVLEVVEANGGGDGRPGKHGAGTAHLARALGWPTVPETGHCPRLSKCLKRARQARDAAALPPTEGT